MTEEVVTEAIGFMVPVIYEVKKVNVNRSIAAALTQCATVKTANRWLFSIGSL